MDWLAPFLELRPEGLYASAFDAFLDPPAPVGRALLSHAHSDHAAAGHSEVWATPETLGIYRRRHPEWQGAAREIAYGGEVAGRGALLTFVPAGHVLGSAQIHFVSEGSSLLYTGDFKRRPCRTAAPAAAPRARTLVIESTFGLPVFRFPNRQTLEALLVMACRDAFEKEKTPVVLAYAFGKAQEAAAILAEAEIPTVLHGAAWKLVPEFERAGIPLPLSRAYETGPVQPGEALVVPPTCARTPVVRNVKRRSIIYLSGWAIREAARADFDADVLIPFSDHADFPDLLHHVSEVAPERVIAMHGYAPDFARILASRGIPAAALTEATERSSEEP